MDKKTKNKIAETGERVKFLKFIYSELLVAPNEILPISRYLLATFLTYTTENSTRKIANLHLEVYVTPQRWYLCTKSHCVT